MNVRHTLGMASALLLAACAAVGPEPARPALPPTAGYAPAAALPAATASSPGAFGAAQRFVASALPRAWWQLFGSPALDRLVQCALRASPTIESAQAALRAAQENEAAQRGFFFPTVQASYQPSRTKIAGNSGGNSPGVQGDGSVIATASNPPAATGGAAPFNAPVIYGYHTAQLSVSYAPDVFGAVHRQVEAAQAQSEVQRLQLAAAAMSLAANVVGAAIQAAMLHEQVALAEASVQSNADALAIVRRQRAAGWASALDTALQEAALAQARQALPPLRKALGQTQHLLLALLGLPADAALPELPRLADLHLPAELPVALPSQLVDSRPDIAAAEAQLRAASAQVGIALAARLPQFTISGAFGGMAAHPAQMFWASGRFFNLGLDVTQQLFDGGTLEHRQRAAEAGLRQAAAQYRATAIAAFQNVADALTAIDTDARALAEADTAETAARAAVELARRQIAAGAIDRLTLLAAERAWQQAAAARLQAAGARLGDTVALCQAVGGADWDAASVVTADRDASAPPRVR